MPEEKKDAGNHGGGNKMVQVGVGAFVILLALGIGFSMLGPGIAALGEGMKAFMMAITVAMASNVPLALILILIPLAAVLGLLFMAAKAHLGGGKSGGDHH